MVLLDSDWHCIKDIDNNNLYGLDSSNVVLNGTASMMIDETTGKVCKPLILLFLTFPITVGTVITSTIPSRTITASNSIWIR